jgi:hypothetical protein
LPRASSPPPKVNRISLWLSSYGYMYHSAWLNIKLALPPCASGSQRQSPDGRASASCPPVTPVCENSHTFIFENDFVFVTIGFYRTLGPDLAGCPPIQREDKLEFASLKNPFQNTNGARSTICNRDDAHRKTSRGSERRRGRSSRFTVSNRFASLRPALYE